MELTEPVLLGFWDGRSDFESYASVQKKKEKTNWKKSKVK